MTKAELIAKVAENAGTTKRLAEACINATVEALAEAIANGERTAIPSLGVFSVRERKARKGRNPRTGKEIKIPARKVVVFKPAKVLREKVNK